VRFQEFFPLSPSALCRGSSGVWILGTRPRMTQFSCVPACVPGPRLGPGINPGHPSDLWPSPFHREAGFARACAAASRKRGSRELKETSRKHGPLNLAPLFYVIGAQSSGPSGGDCTLPRSPGLVSGRTACPRQGSGRSPCKKKRKRPVETDCPSASTRLCSTPGFPPGGRCRVPVRSETGRYSRTSFTKPSGLTSRMETHFWSRSLSENRIHFSDCAPVHPFLRSR
jgi:hypothetical protein